MSVSLTYCVHFKKKGIKLKIRLASEKGIKKQFFSIILI